MRTFRPGHRGQQAAALLEVVLALALLVLAMGVVSGALSSAARAVQQLKREATAEDLAVTVMSWMELGILESDAHGEQAFSDERWQDWNWRVETVEHEDPVGLDGIVHLVVVVKHRDAGWSYRLAGIFPTGNLP